MTSIANQTRWPSSAAAKSGRRQSSLGNATARLLVLGAKQVGKSAAIVRFTTGRFIQNYCPSTQDWLYKHPIEHQKQEEEKLLETTKPISTLELLELEDLEQPELGEQSIRSTHPTSAEKLHWADAFVVIYSLTSSSTFDKAKSYLDLVKLASHQQQPNGLASQKRTTVPILLLANKIDLGAQARQVTSKEGAELARLHECLFAEISISQSVDSISKIIMQLVGQIDPIRLSRCSSSLDGNVQTAATTLAGRTQLVKWRPGSVCGEINIPSAQVQNRSSSNGGPSKPIWSSLVRTRLPIVSSLTIGSHQIASPQAGAIVSVSTSSSTAAAGVDYCRPLLSPAPTNATVSYVSLGELAQVQTVSSLNPLVASRLKPTSINGTPEEQQQQPQANKQRYVGTLRSSFKRASLAIVGGKTLAFKSKFTSRAVQNKDSQSVESSRKLSTPVVPDQSQMQEQQQQQPQKVPNGFRRPLFKYRNRVKTVAFEPSYTSSGETIAPIVETPLQPSDSTQTIDATTMVEANLKTRDNAKILQVSRNSRCNEQQHDGQPLEHQMAPSDTKSSSGSSLSGYNLNRCNSDRSNSSLSTSDTYYNSLFIVCQNDQSPPSQKSDHQKQPRGQAERAELGGHGTVVESAKICRPLPSSSACSTSSGRESRSSSILSGSGGSGLASGTRSILQKLSMKQRKDSRSTLSRASTSGGSYGDDDEDDDAAMVLSEISADEDELTTANDQGGNLVRSSWLEDGRYGATPSRSRAGTVYVNYSNNHNNPNANKPPMGREQQQQLAIKAARHYQLVETIQQDNMTTQIQAPRIGKISFCKALIRSIGHGGGGPKRCEAAMMFRASETEQSAIYHSQQHKHQDQHLAQVGVRLLAATEQIKTIPVTGFCK